MSFSTNVTNIFDTDSGNLYQLDHRKFTVQHCDAKAAARRQLLDQSKHTGLISGLGKLAGIEGTGVIQEALDAIVSATHVGGTEWERIVDGGVEGILTSVLGDQATNFLTGILNDVNPHAVNQAVSNAEKVFDKIKNQDFDWRDIPQYLADFKNLYTLGATIVDPFISNNVANMEPVVACSASPYATDLVSLGVKFKFLFVAQINFNPSYQQLQNTDPSFIVKSADRPSVTYEYEDINCYNFRTKVAKRGTFNNVKFTFYDDEQNNATAFYNAMVRLMSPLANTNAPMLMQDTGMEFNVPTVDTAGPDSPTQGIIGYKHGATVGPTLGTNVSIIDSIDLYHVYSGGQKVNQYRFHNPRVVNIALDALDMTSESITELQMEFAYDMVEITNAVSMTTVVHDRPGFRYPLGGPNPLPSAAAESPTTVSAASAAALANGTGFVEGITDVANTYYQDKAAKLTQIFKEEGLSGTVGLL